MFYHIVILLSLVPMIALAHDQSSLDDLELQFNEPFSSENQDCLPKAPFALFTKSIDSPSLDSYEITIELETQNNLVERVNHSVIMEGAELISTESIISPDETQKTLKLKVRKTMPTNSSVTIYAEGELKDNHERVTNSIEISLAAIVSDTTREIVRLSSGELREVEMVKRIKR